MKEHGDYVPPDKQHARRNHNLYRTLSDANTKEADAELSSCHVYQEFHEFWCITCIMRDILKPDLLHTIQIGMLNHLQKWIFQFIMTHQQRDKYNAIWLTVCAYYDLTPNNKS